MDGLTIVAILAVVLMAAGALALALRPSAGGARLLVPHTVQACIFSFDDATQSWAKLLALLGEVSARARHMASHTPHGYPTTHTLTVRVLPVAAPGSWLPHRPRHVSASLRVRGEDGRASGGAGGDGRDRDGQ